MSGDYSRIAYDPLRDYNGVLLQQGRPLTDRDWNDFAAQEARLQQATRHDTFGGAAVVPRTTPHGFELGLAGGQLTIGPGRIYVDGLLAENHGLAPQAWDPVLAEPYDPAPVPYDMQRGYPGAPPLPTSGGPYLVYVDVWEREVTHLVDPDLVEVALGVDTTTRIQTVWQVKFLANDNLAALACDTDPAAIPGWAALTAPSAGRLTTGVAQYGQESPCLIPPAGGYTGLENQLYRVEIHEGGAPGKATFKWSRDNASVETRLVRFADAARKTLVVESVGKDTVLRFNDGDWIEVLDDWCELHNQPGELHRIAVLHGVEDTTRTITLDTAVSAASFPADANGNPVAGRHTRIRRWDQAGKVLRTDTAQPTVYTDLDVAGSGGAIVVPGSGSVKIALENGIVVSFDVASAGGVFKSGDTWLCAARTVDASVDPLTQAPPRGIHHHYAKLGLLAPGNQPIDCRQFWPPAFGAENCACSICVSPDAHRAGKPSVQQAINTVIAHGGGTVCLEIGEYELDRPLVLENARSLTLRGQGDGTRLTGRATALRISKGTDVTLERFTLQSASESASTSFAAIAVDSTKRLRAQRIAVNLRSENPGSAAIALSGTLAELTVCDSLLHAPLGIIGAEGARDLKRGPIALGGLRVEDNVLQCTVSAIELQLAAESQPPLRVLRNRISGCSGFGIELIASGIADGGIEIIGNRLEVGGSGIVVGVPGLRIVDNAVSRAGDSSARKPGVGIGLMPLRGDVATPGNGHILGNRVAGFGGAGILVEMALGKLQVKQNQVEHCGAGIDVADSKASELLSIENNQVSDIDGDESGQVRLIGIGVAGARAVSILGNEIVRLGLRSRSPNLTTSAVLLQNCDGVRIIGNDLSDIGPADLFSGAVVGILVQSPAGDLIVDDNRMRRDSEARDADASSWLGIVIVGAQAQLSVIAKASGRELAELVPEGLRRFSVDIDQLQKSRRSAVAAASSAGLSVSVRGNQVAARGGAFCVAILAAPHCDFSNNLCRRSTAAGAVSTGALPDVLLAAQSLVVAGNRVSGQRGPSMSLQSQEGRYTVLGNVTSGGILVQGAALGEPWASLNREAS